MQKVKNVRFRTMDMGDYLVVPFTDCIHIKDDVHVCWIDIIEGELVITTEKECVYSKDDEWLRLKPEVCPTCGQEIKEEG